jgi:two-component system, cell cycle sensor histidine kinase and response regulator CckA
MKAKADKRHAVSFCPAGKISITAVLFIGNAVFFELFGLRAELGIGTSASLFLIPVLLAGAFWGLAGGLITAAASSVFMLTAMFVSAPEMLSPALVGPHLLFIGFGVLVGKLFDLRKAIISERDLLRQSEVRYKRLFEESAIPMYHTTMDGNIMAANDAFLRALGIPDDTTIETLNAADLYADPADREELIGILKREGRISNKEVNLRKYDGGMLIVVINANFVVETDGTRRFEGSFIDVTEVKLLEAEHKQVAELKERERSMTAVTRLAGGLAHDINNILGGIQGHAQILELKLPKEDPLRKSVVNILAAVGKAAEIIRGLLASVGTVSFTLKPVDINDFVRRNVDKFMQVMENPVKINLQLSNEVIDVSMDETLAEELLRELLENAVQASAAEDEIRIVTGIEYPGPEVTHSFLPDPEEACGYISVIDTGRGMDEATLEKIFEPYFTTEEFGTGAGIGMTTVYGIVRQHQGAIEVLSGPGAGTTVIVFFRLYSDEKGNGKTGETVS